MTTQFSQQVPFTFLLRLSSDNSYFCLYPREIRRDSDKHLNFFGYSSPGTLDNVLPHYSPPTPVDFNQFGPSWCNESLSAYLNLIGLSSIFNAFYYEGVVYQPNGNNQSASGIYNALLVGRLVVNNEIDTDFDNLFSDLISQITASAVSIATQISDTNTNLLSVILNLTNINGNLGNIKSSLDNLNIDIGDVDIQTDDLVSQLQNIYTILASQNSNQAAISSAINNKDNQSNLVKILEDIFIYETTDSNNKYSSMKYNFVGNKYNSNITNQLNIISKIQTLCNCFLTSNSSVTNTSGFTVSNRLLSLLASLNNVDTNGNIANNLHSVSSLSKLNYLSEIETKLEQNLPFVTNVDNVLVIDGQQEFKIRNKNNDEDFE